MLQKNICLFGEMIGILPVCSLSSCAHERQIRKAGTHYSISEPVARSTAMKTKAQNITFRRILH